MRNMLALPEGNLIENCLPLKHPQRQAVVAALKMDLLFRPHPYFKDTAKIRWFLKWQPTFAASDVASVWNRLLAKVDGTTIKLSDEFTLTSEEERMFFLRLNYAKLRLRRHYGTAIRGRRHLNEQEVESVLRWGTLLKSSRDAVAIANLGLVLSMGRKYGYFQTYDTTLLIPEGFEAVLRAIDRFDVSRGFKFSTYACRCILQSWSRQCQKLVSQATKEHCTDFCEIDVKDNKDHDPTHRSDVIDIHSILEANKAGLDANELTVLRRRYFQYETLEQVGDRIGLTKERVRQIQNKAIDKLRGVLMPN